MTEIGAETARLPQVQPQGQKNRLSAGIVYLGWVPPKMTPSKLRGLMSQYGEVNRIYLAPEDQVARKRRRQQGGSRSKLFVEGWIEFVRRKDAKQAAMMLHNEPIGGKSSNRYDLWCLRYLPKVTWDMLTEEVQQYRAIKDTRLKAELAQAKLEKDFYLAQVDKAKKMEAILERRQRQAQTSSLKPAADRPSQSGLLGELSSRHRKQEHAGKHNQTIVGEQSAAIATKGSENEQSAGTGALSGSRRISDSIEPQFTAALKDRKIRQRAVFGQESRGHVPKKRLLLIDDGNGNDRFASAGGGERQGKRLKLGVDSMEKKSRFGGGVALGGRKKVRAVGEDKLGDDVISLLIGAS